MAEPVDNLRTFLSVAGEMILEIASKNISKPMKLQNGDRYEEVVG
jgi:hypothetical protein